MSDDLELEEFYEVFGSQPLLGSELDAMTERARAASDVQLRRLVKEVQTLRWLLPVLLERIEKSGSPVDEVNDEVLKIARFLVRGERSIGGA